MRTKMGLSALAGVILIFAAAACDFSPSAPFAGFEEEQQQGATLHGQFQQNGVAAVSRQSTALGFGASRSLATGASSEEITVTRVDVYEGVYEGEVVSEETLIGGVDVDDDGSFTIRGLPETFTLVFIYVDDDGNDAEAGSETFDGVKPNQEIDIVLAMEDGTVTVVSDSRTGIDHEGSSGIEIDGTAENVYFESNLMTGYFDVNDYHVITRAGETSIRKGQESLTLKDIRGKQVHVRGVFEYDDVFAFEIKLQEEDEDEDEVAPASGCDVWDTDKSGKILVCHNGNTLSISPDAWPDHSAHGDKCGKC